MYDNKNALSILGTSCDTHMGKEEQNPENPGNLGQNSTMQNPGNSGEEGQNPENPARQRWAKLYNTKSRELRQRRAESRKLR